MRSGPEGSARPWGWAVGWGFVSIGLLVAVPLAGLLGVRWGVQRTASHLTVPPEPVHVTASTVPFDDRTAVTVRLVEERPAVVRAAGWAGLVTGVHVTPGDSPRTGDPVVSVDGATRIGVATSAPFWRPLRRGHEGDDVAELQGVLELLGFGDPREEGDAEGTFGAATVASVRRWAQAQGFDGAAGTFDPAWVVWLPHEPFEVAEVLVAPGATAPPAGTEIFTGIPRLERLELQRADGQPLTSDGRPRLLEVASLTLELEPSLELKGSALEALRAAVPAGTDEVPGVLTLAEPREAVVVPATALVLGSDGQHCVWIEADGGLRSRPVTVAAIQPGTVEVSAGLDPGDRVLANPGDVLTEPSCG